MARGRVEGESSTRYPKKSLAAKGRGKSKGSRLEEKEKKVSLGKRESSIVDRVNGIPNPRGN